MLIDAFMGFNELKLAEFRIKYLQNYVDRTIILESNITHSGREKPLYFTDWLNSRIEFLPKVQVITVDLSKLTENWERERYSRSFLYDYILLNYPNSKFIFSDLDEIPSCDQVQTFLDCDTYLKFSCLTYFRCANYRMEGRGRNWNRGVFGITNLPRIEQGGRYSKLPLVSSSSPGGHFSYLDYEKGSISKKLESFAHQELNFDLLKSKEFIDFCDKYSLSHIGGARHPGFGFLTKLRFEELTSIQKSLHNFESKFFDFEYYKFGHASRIAASILVSAAINNPQRGDLIFQTFIKKSGKLTMQSINFIFVELYFIFLKHLIALVKKAVYWQRI